MKLFRKSYFFVFVILSAAKDLITAGILCNKDAQS